MTASMRLADCSALPPAARGSGSPAQSRAKATPGVELPEPGTKLSGMA